MDEIGLSKAAARTLRRHIEEKRRELGLALLHGMGVRSRTAAVGRAAFLEGLLDRLRDELGSGDTLLTEKWVADGAQPDWPDKQGLVACSFAIVAASYAAQHIDGATVAHYLALRGRRLDGILESALAEGRRVADGDERVARDEVVTSLLASLEARDAATCDHSRSVGLWARRIAAALEMPAEEQTFVGLCGTLHDVGKLSTPRSILLKPGPLDEDEWTTMREHSAAGARIVSRVPSLRACANVIRAHHERIDGHGYPDGLERAAIPLPARIIAVADAFHAMVSRRPYRPPLPVAGALQQLNDGRDVRWDTTIVDSLHALLRSRLGNKLERAASGD
ncbi:MAG: HD domain-containing protein [Candidatus Eremiobacteraeota bacterium]|nr:HD domain-containing protein [Candidatus Eremiobacteraeota bacterium]